MSDASRIDRPQADRATAFAANEAGGLRAVTLPAECTFEETYQLLANSLLAFLINQLWNRHDAEEASQQAWLQAYRGWPPARTDNLRAWLFEIARHVAVDFRRRRSKRGASAASLNTESQGDPPAPRSSGPLESVLEHEDLDRRKVALQSCLGRLSDEERQIFLARQQGESYEELRDQFGIEQNRAYGLLHAAVQRLKDCVRKHLQ